MDKTIHQRWLEYDKKDGPRYRDLLRNFTRIYRDKGRKLRVDLGVQKALDATLIGMKSHGNSGADNNEIRETCFSNSPHVFGNATCNSLPGFTQSKNDCICSNGSVIWTNSYPSCVVKN
ncbi:hypothetical protein ACTFIV_004871 [Dictyostelium citrinum]